MAAPVVAGKSKGPIINPARCRCCRALKKCRLLTSEYEWMNQKEVYSDMFVDCFGLLLSHLDGASDGAEYGICATCVVRLRDACAFRRQVLQCEQELLHSVLHKQDPDKKMDVEVKPEPHCDEAVEDVVSMDGGDDMHSTDDIDNRQIEAETKPAVKKLKTSPAQRERKPRKAKNKKSVAKKEIISKMKKLRNKLESMIDEPVPEETDPPATNKRKKSQLNHDAMVFNNAITIVHNSYVCPFVNRTSMFYCYYCKDQFTNPAELREHTLKHDPKDFESMIEYNKIPKIDITRIDCRLCTERIDNIDSFKRHITSVHGKSLYDVTNEFLKFKLTMDSIKCVECSEVFPYFDSLMKHMIDHFGTHICDMCGACFLEVTSLRSHIRTHNKVEVNYPCEICGKNLKSKYSRYLHVASVHEKKPTVNCYKCEESFLSYALRNKHLIEVHGDKRTFPCKLCDKVYNRRKTLVEHNRRNHLKVFRHQCDLCDQRFYLPSRLKEHMSTHTGERNFRCEFCDKSYPRLQSLQEHIRTHSNDKRYKCHVCGSAFSQNGTLKNHMKSLHQYDLDAGFS